MNASATGSLVVGRARCYRAHSRKILKKHLDRDTKSMNETLIPRTRALRQSETARAEARSRPEGALGLFLARPRGRGCSKNLGRTSRPYGRGPASSPTTGTARGIRFHAWGQRSTHVLYIQGTRGGHRGLAHRMRWASREGRGARFLTPAAGPCQSSHPGAEPR